MQEIWKFFEDPELDKRICLLVIAMPMMMIDTMLRLGGEVSDWKGALSVLIHIPAIILQIYNFQMNIIHFPWMFYRIFWHEGHRCVWSFVHNASDCFHRPRHPSSCLLSKSEKSEKSSILKNSTKQVSMIKKFFLSIHESDRQKLFSTPAAAVALPSEERNQMMGQVMMMTRIMRIMMMTMMLSMILMTMMLSLIYSRCRVCGRSG